MSKQLDELERKTDEQRRELETLKIAVKKIEQVDEIKRVIKDQQGGLFKYFLDLFKIILAIVIIASGSKLADQPWIHDLVNN